MVKVVCTMYKLTQEATLLLCFEQFVIDKVIVCKAIHKVVVAINKEFKQEMQFPKGSEQLESMIKFFEFCGLLGVVGATNDIYFKI